MWLILTGIALAAVYYLLAIKPFKYWPKRGVKQGNPKPIFGENWGTVFRTQSFVDMVKMVYNQVPNTRYSGIYQFSLPTLVLKDPELIKQICVKDFDHFLDHRSFLPDDVDPLWANNLFALKGQKWRDMRSTLSPSFTSSKMKNMFVLINDVAKNFSKYFTNKGENTLELEMKDAFTRFTNDVIASTAFGVQCDSLKDRNNEFYVMGKEATNMTSVWKSIKLFSIFLFPKLSQLLGFRFFSKQVGTFFTTLVKETLRMREEKQIYRPDMLQLLKEAQNSNLKHNENALKQNGGLENGAAKELKREITDIDITSQALIFFFAGFDSVSSLMCFMCYELAVNPDVQEKLYEEIKETQLECGEDLTYEALNKMNYFDMIISESLRKWPNAVAVDRVCTKPYTIEPKTPDETPLHLVKGDICWLPIFALHRDPKFFPDPDKFDPERFSDENKNKIVPYSYIPFGVGPRNCIGNRFAILETKALFYHILRNFEIVPSKKTDIPIKISKASFALTSETGFWFEFKKRNDRGSFFA